MTITTEDLERTKILNCCYLLMGELRDVAGGTVFPPHCERTSARPQSAVDCESAPKVAPSRTILFANFSALYIHFFRTYGQLVPRDRRSEVSFLDEAIAPASERHPVAP